MSCRLRLIIVVRSRKILGEDRGSPSMVWSALDDRTKLFGEIADLFEKIRGVFVGDVLSAFSDFNCEMWHYPGVQSVFFEFDSCDSKQRYDT